MKKLISIKRVLINHWKSWFRRREVLKTRSCGSIWPALLMCAAFLVSARQVSAVGLFATQGIDVGTVTVWNDADYLYVQYNTTGGWCLAETHVHVGKSLSDFPLQPRSLNPVPGQFAHSDPHGCNTQYRYALERGEWGPGDELLIAAHAKVQKGTTEETAWAAHELGVIRFTERGSWATYFQYTVVPETVTDIDGNVYPIVRIGDQWWMAENLRVSRYRNGSDIPYVLEPGDWQYLTTGAWAYYAHDAFYGGFYGKLYNWYAVTDPRGLCPTGWHVPTDGEWKELEVHLGMTWEEADSWGSLGWRGPGVGSKMKSTRTYPDPHSRWNEPNSDATNESGFSAFPGGHRDYFGWFGHYLEIGYDGYWWSSTLWVDPNVWPPAGVYRALSYYWGQVCRSLQHRQAGMSVRCLRD